MAKNLQHFLSSHEQSSWKDDKNRTTKPIEQWQLVRSYQTLWCSGLSIFRTRKLCSARIWIVKQYIRFALWICPKRHVKDSNEYFFLIQNYCEETEVWHQYLEICQARELACPIPSLWSVFSATRISFGFFLPYPSFPLVFFPCPFVWGKRKQVQ